MRKILFNVLILTILLSISRSVPTAITPSPYNAATLHSLAPISYSAESQNELTWLHVGQSTGPNAHVVYATVDTTTNTLTQRSLTISGQSTSTVSVLAHSNTLQCAIVKDTTAGSVSAYKFNANNPPVFASLTTGGTPIVAAGDIATTTYKAGKNCQGLLVIKTGTNYFSYHWNSTATPPAYQLDTLPSPIWANPQFNQEHTIAVGDGGIYTYTSSSKVWAKTANTQTFNTFKKIYYSASKLVVLSWQAGTPSTDKDYKLHVYSHASGVFTLVYNVSGTAYNDVPKLAISPSFNTFILYHQVTATGHALNLIGKVVDYTARTHAALTLPTLITGATNIYLAITDRFVYARTTAGTLQIASYAIWGTNLVVYEAAVVNAVTTYTRNLIKSPSQHILQVFYQKPGGANIYDIQKQIYYGMNTIFNWFTKDGPATITNITTDLRQAARANSWWLQSIVGGNKVFSAVTIPPSGYTPSIVKTTATLANTYVTRSVSPSQTCGIISNGITTLEVWNFASTNPSVAYSDISTLVTLANIPTITYGLADACTAFRLDSKVYHWDTSAYFEDTPMPVGALTSTTAFSQDYSYMVSDSAVYKYTPRANPTAGFYSLQRNDSFYTTKQVLKSNTKVIIFSYQLNASSIYQWKIQFNSIVSGVLTKFAEYNGTSFGLPKLQVSPSYNRIIIYGNSLSASTWLYVGKSIDFTNRLVKDIAFPANITSIGNQITLGDSFVYFRTLIADPITGLKKHWGYSIQSTTLFLIFSQNVVEYKALNYQRTLIIPDLILQKMVVAYQFNANDYIIVEKETKKSVYDIMISDKPPMEESVLTVLTTDATSGMLTRASTAPGKYSWLDSSPKLQYSQYNPSIANTKIKAFASSTLTSGLSKKASSPNQDCVITYKSAAQVNIHYINDTGNGTITTIQNMQTTILADLTTDAAIATALNTVVLTNACQKFKLGRYVYYKNLTATPKFTKAPITISNDWTTAVFDPTLRFAFKSNVIYQFTTNDYTPILLNITLSPNVQMIASSDGTKLLVLHYTSTGPLSFEVRLFGSMNGIWFQSPNKVANSTTYTAITPFMPTMIASPDFQTVGLGYMDGATPAPSGVIRKINYNVLPPTITQYSGPIQLVSLTNMPTFIFTNNFFYFRTNQLSGNDKQIIYQIDKTNNKVFELSRMTSLPASVILTNKQTYLEEINNRLTIFYDIQVPVSSNTVSSLYKRQLNDVTVQTYAKLSDVSYTVMNNVIYTCPPGCINCQNNNRNCQTCADGFVLDSTSKLCVPCGTPCKACTVATPSVCLSSGGCFPGYFYDGVSSCTKCHESCLTCTAASSTSCATCKLGYYKTGGNDCQPCIENCLSCPSSSVCNANGCRPGYTWDSVSGTCVKCISGCQSCNYLRLYECSACGTGFQAVLNASTIIACKACPQFCTTCSSGICYACRDQYVLTSSNTCVQKCKPPCLSCADGTSTICVTCPGGYLLSGTTCVPDLSCSANSSCVNCPIGFILLNKQCYQCNGGPNCESCSAVNAQVCVSCLRGYYLSTNQVCASCITGCAKCNNPNFCIQCTKGYTLSGAASPATCLKCDASCQTCFNSIYACETCAPGYTKSGWTCISNSYVAWVVKLDVAFSLITTANLEDLRRYVIQVTSRSTQDYVVKSIVTGSTVVTGTLGVGSTDAAVQTAVVNTLASAFVSGTPIGGIPVVDSSFTALTTNGQVITGEDKSTYYRNVAIIVGVVIPVAIVIIFVVIIIVLMKKGAFAGVAGSNAAKIGDVSMDKLHVKQQRKDSQMNSIRRNQLPPLAQ